VSIIEVSGLSKQYHIGTKLPYKSLRETIMNVVTSPARLFKRNGSGENNTIWALKDVSFEVQQGEVLGIIGRNGAGKTTLLKILSRVTEPTEGEVRIRGRVGSLLEVGTGFHPELTGRENIFLNGAILGMRKEEIKKKFDEIVAFAEVEKFLDTPMKRYSSGMYVRLAFAVAAHLEPEILLVDEVLAVGDAAFQKKCLGKMGDVAKEGRTVLFVSHNMGAVRSLCQRCNLLESGRLIFSGNVNECIDSYLSDISKDIPGEVDIALLQRSSNMTDSSLRILRVRINGENGRALIRSGQPLEVEMQFRSTQPLSEVVFGFGIFSVNNIRLIECRSTDTLEPIYLPSPGEYSIRCTLNNILAQGTYILGVGARCSNKGLDYVPNALMFEVQDVEHYKSLWLEATSGFIRIQSQWNGPTPAV
jgi:lipopolysaccharide transport system ATP-binding protein